MLQDLRTTLRPVEYPQAEQFWLLTNQSHWIYTEAQVTDDGFDWKFNLDPQYKEIIKRSLGLFTFAEQFVGNYWVKVYEWFPNPEVQAMALAFASSESMHARAYANVFDTLGESDAILHEVDVNPRLKEKLSRLVDSRSIPMSLAVFSGFTEGVSLFATFALLINFSRKGLMKGLKQTIEWSARDEAIHAEGGTWLFTTHIAEQPTLMTEDLAQQIYAAAADTIALEDDYLDYIFGDVDTIFPGELCALSKQDLKEFVRFLVDKRLKGLGLQSLGAKHLDLDWFWPMIFGEQNSDFFVSLPTDYSKGAVNMEAAW